MEYKVWWVIEVTLHLPDFPTVLEAPVLQTGVGVITQKVYPLPNILGLGLCG